MVSHLRSFFEVQKTGELNKSRQVLIGEVLACKVAAVVGALKSLPGGSLQNQKLHLCRIGKRKKCMRQDGKDTVYHVLAVRPRTEGDRLENFPNWAEL